MIKCYNPNFEGTHVVRVTFMQYNYVGHVAFRIGGNCKGVDLLNADFLDDDTQEVINSYEENDCKFSFDEEYEIFTATLVNNNGDTLEVDGHGEEFKDMIVGIEFSNLYPKKEIRKK